jgi:hypothetical protein
MAAVMAFLAISAFYVGSHIHRWLVRPIRIKPVDQASLSFLSSLSTSSLLVQTPDRRTVLITTDFTPIAINPLIQAAKLRGINTIDALVLTSVSSSTSVAIIWLNDRIPVNGPIITPYQEMNRPEWWQHTETSLNSELKNREFDVISWENSGPALGQAAPELGITFFTPGVARWDAPVLAVELTYQLSNLLDISSLNSSQTAAVTDLPLGAGCRILMVGAGNVPVAKELLAQTQPDVVVMSGSPGSIPLNISQDNIHAADAQAVNLSENTPVAANLPASNNRPINILQ